MQQAHAFCTQWRRTAVVIGLACATGAASAAPTVYDFTIDWSSGDLAGTSAQGWLSLDNPTLASPNAIYTLGPTQLLSDFSFQLRGKTYGLADVSVGYLAYDANAALSAIEFGTDCRPPSVCGVVSGNLNSFSVSSSPEQTPTFIGMAAGTLADNFSQGGGSLSVRSVLPIPEPSTLALMLAGLGVIGVAQRRWRVG